MVAMQTALKTQLRISNSHHSTNQRVIKPLAFWAGDKSHSNVDGGRPLRESFEACGWSGTPLCDIFNIERLLDEVAGMANLAEDF
jgi:hypothetical protein